MLSFGHKNAKLGKNVLTFSLPAGYSCPGAKDCLSRANRKTGKITDGPETQFRCFSASAEALYPNVRQSRWSNFEQLKRLKTADEMARLIEASLKENAKLVRCHVSGDFYSQEYLDAWLIVAYHRPKTKFYFYTKSLDFWVNRINLIGNGFRRGLLHNVIPTASYGGKFDSLISEYSLRSAKVVYSKRDAKALRLKIDHTDKLAMKHGNDFALLLHGVQPGGTPAAKALSALKAEGEFGYGKKADLRRKSLTLVS